MPFSHTMPMDENVLSLQSGQHPSTVLAHSFPPSCTRLLPVSLLLSQVDHSGEACVDALVCVQSYFVAVLVIADKKTWR